MSATPSVCSCCAGTDPDCYICAQFAQQPVRELAETIVAGHAFADADAVRVARAFLRMDEEGT